MTFKYNHGQTVGINLNEVPNAELLTLIMYISGHDPRQSLGRNTYFRHKRNLLAIGYDIQDIALVTGKFELGYWFQTLQETIKIMEKQQQSING